MGWDLAPAREVGCRVCPWDPLHPQGPGRSPHRTLRSFRGGCFSDCPHTPVAPLVFPTWGRTGSAVAAAEPWVGASGLLQPAAGLGQRDGRPAVPGEGGIELTGGVLRGAEPSLGSEPASAAIWGQEGGKGLGNPSFWLCFPCWVPAMGLGGGSWSAGCFSLPGLTRGPKKSFQL